MNKVAVLRQNEPTHVTSRGPPTAMAFSDAHRCLIL